MALRAVEHIFTGLTTPYASYDPAKTNLGVLIQQRTGATALDKYAGPMPLGLARPMEASTAIAGAYPHVIPWDSDNDWVFLVDNGTAAATRRVIMYNYQKSTSTFTWNGFITLTFPTATNHTVRGFRMNRELYTTGTASVSGTAVTGSGTGWNSSNIPVGCRIGFGSSDPTQIATWHEISAIGSDTSITLTASAGTISSGNYVIEDLRVLVSTTNATAANGGVYMAKGLREELFAPAGTTISAASTTDGLRAVYWLADAGTVTNTISCGLAIDARDSWTQHYIYIIDGTTTTCRVYKYNIRATLGSLSSGKSTSAYVHVTAAQTPTGTVSQTNNGRIDTLSHGPANGVKSLYFVTTTRVYRAAVANLTSGNATWQSDAMVEVAPGGASTYAATGALSSCEIASQIDRLIVISTGTAGARSYVTKYNTNSDPFDHIFLVDDKQLDQSIADNDAVIHPAINATAFSVWSEGGIAYLCRLGTAATTNQMYAVPLSAHWTYAAGSANQRLITPAMSTPSASRLTRVYVNATRHIGAGTVGLPTEPYRMYFRISGISDDSGEWTLVTEDGGFTDPTPSTEIQFMFEFKVIGAFCIPARIHGVTIVYEDDTTDSHYQPSVAQSSISSKVFAWRFSTAFGGTVPTLRIRLYNATTGSLLLDDTTTASALGTWEKSTNDGAAWGSYNTTDKANDTTYIRYTPTSIADNIKVRALLTQN